MHHLKFTTFSMSWLDMNSTTLLLTNWHDCTLNVYLPSRPILVVNKLVLLSLHVSYFTLGRVFLYTMLYKLWTHRGVITPLLHFYTVDPVGTVTAIHVERSVDFVCGGTCTTGCCLRKILHLPSFKFFSSSKICTLVLLRRATYYDRDVFFLHVRRRCHVRAA